MPPRRSSHVQLIGLAFLTASTLFAPAVRAEDQPKPKFGTEDWFLAKLDQAADKAISAGASALKEAALGLAASVLDSYIPGISALLGFGSSDPFAAHAERILNRIDQAEDNIIAAVLANARDEQVKVTWPWIREEYLDIMRSNTKLADYVSGHTAELDGTMDRLRINLQNRENVFRLDSLHTLATLMAMHVKLKEQMALTATLVENGYDTRDLEDLAPEEVAELDAQARLKAAREVDTLLFGPNGMLSYLESLGRTNKYRTYAFQSFGTMERVDDTYQYTVKYMYSVLDPNRPDDATRYTNETRYTIALSRPQEIICPRDPAVVFALKLPDGTRIERCVADAGDYGAAYQLYLAHRQWTYEQALLLVYAPVRVIVQGLYQNVGRQPPVSEADQDLDNLVLTRTCPKCAQVEIEHLLASARDGRSLTALEMRVVTNYLIMYGWKALTQLRFSAYANDPFAVEMGGPTVEDYLALLSAATPPEMFESQFKGQFAAKVITIL